ncbi:MAG: hypothetical protein GWN71_43690, partial [Gammaproteobacteria bacterium]|nr:hypothetical protein [Gemmatimonadota bacterium]NIR39808.1 hypothetical protein [Actinomycetota bacterium]NIU80196.1 hypothetical protein [Gammaproteobacteria bacterium]NIX25685.1 hypothetical protein [Actinomycetota bacterium]
FLEVVIQEKRATQRLEPPGPMQETLEDVVQRVTLLERRLEFAENLIAAPRAGGSIPAPAESGRGADPGRARVVGGMQPPEPTG